MRAFVEVVCPGNADSGSAFHLFIDGTRFQFGCGDGAQRTAVESGVKPSKLATILVPTLSACDVGGLPGMLLTASDAGMNEIIVAGPPGLSALLHAARPFFHRPSLKLMVRELSKKTFVVYKENDEAVKISGVHISPKATAFVARFKDMRGRFDSTRAQALGVPRGRLYGVLQKGTAVTLDDGTVIQPEQVMAPNTPGPVVVSVPPLVSAADMDAFLSCEYLSSEALKSTDTGRIVLVVHFAAAEIVSDNRYRKWVDSLGTCVKHLVLHRDYAPQRAVFSANAAEIARLHDGIDHKLFPLPIHSSRLLPPGTDADIDPEPVRSSYPISADALPPSWLRADMRLRYNLAPRNVAGQVDNSFIPDARVPRLPCGPPPTLQKSSGKWFQRASPPESVQPSSNISLENSTTEVSFLGTGAAMPGKHRNVSSYHVNVASRCGVLLDCGEGTFGQLWRMHGEAGTAQVLAQMRLMFISHMHADHHLGALRVLAERARIGGDDLARVAVVAPREFEKWLRQALLHDGDGIDGIQLFDCAELTDPQTPAARYFTDSLGLEVGTVRVPHCPDSFGLVLQDTTEKWKLVYSGDTRPCEALIDAGKDATLLIHEATLDDRLGAEAIEKMHCTVGEALEVAEKMRAWRTVLTHFSQRYPKVPALDEKTVKRCTEVGAMVACDMMKVPFKRLEELPLVTARIREVMKKEIEEVLETPSETVT